MPWLPRRLAKKLSIELGFTKPEMPEMPSSESRGFDRFIKEWQIASKRTNKQKENIKYCDSLFVPGIKSSIAVFARLQYESSQKSYLHLPVFFVVGTR